MAGGGGGGGSGDGGGGLQGSSVNLLSQGRLTLLSGDPAPAADQILKGTIYYTPYLGNKVAIYNGSSWDILSFTEISLVLGGLTSAKLYDLFLSNSGGVLTLTNGAAWTNDTTRSASLALQDGVRVLASDHTLRYVGTFRATSTTTTEDSDIRRNIINYYNRVVAKMHVCPNFNSADTDQEYIFTGTTFAKAEPTQAALDFISNGEDSILFVAKLGGSYGSVSDGSVHVATGIDGITDINNDDAMTLIAATAARNSIQTPDERQLSEGRHTADLLLCQPSGLTTVHVLASSAFRGATTSHPVTYLEATIMR